MMSTYDKKAAIAEINRLSKESGGRITPEALVAAASDAESPLHAYFEWDDTEAAKRYRVIQARTMLRACNVIVTINERKVPVPMYVRDPGLDQHTQGYVETARIRTDSDVAREALISEFSRAASLISRARRLAAYFDLGKEFDDLEMQITGIRDRLDSDQELHAA